MIRISETYDTDITGPVVRVPYITENDHLEMGSPEAVALGCRCGAENPAILGPFRIRNVACPLHGPPGDRADIGGGPDMKYWLDTEFIEDGKTIDLISIGIVAGVKEIIYGS